MPNSILESEWINEDNPVNNDQGFDLYDLEAADSIAIQSNHVCMVQM